MEQVNLIVLIVAVEIASDLHGMFSLSIGLSFHDLSNARQLTSGMLLFVRAVHVTAGFTGSYIFSQTIFSLRARVTSRVNGITVSLAELFLFLLPVSVS